MQLHLGHRHVPERHKLTVATAYLDEETADWYMIALSKEGRSEDSAGSKGTRLLHSSAREYRQARARLARIDGKATCRKHRKRTSSPTALTVDSAQHPRGRAPHDDTSSTFSYKSRTSRPVRNKIRSGLDAESRHGNPGSDRSPRIRRE